jgi:DNA-binding transcriptional MerR regulator
MRYSLDELAARCGVSTDEVEPIAHLLPAPEHDIDGVWYGEGHRARLERILALRAAGHDTADIARLVTGDVEASDRALAAALAGPLPGEDADEHVDLDTLAERTGVSKAVLEVIEREGLLAPRVVDGVPRYSASDAQTVRAGLALLQAGVPLGELLDIARRHDSAMRAIAEQAVEVFVRFVRDPIQGTAASEQEASERLVTAFREMLPAASTVVANHFRGLLLTSARERIEADGDAEEIAALRSSAL